MKIGVLTMNYAQNYGGILQCIALQNTLIAMGHSVEVIRFSEREKNSFYRKIKIFAALYAMPSKLFAFFQDAVVERSIKRVTTHNPNILPFIATNIRYTDIVNETSIGVLAERYDAIIVGSDKVWNGLGKNHLTYFFDWEPIYGGKRISYAPCSSTERVPPFNRKKFKELLSRFDAVSVRDKNTFRLVNRETGMTPPIVADPTLLYNFDRLIGERKHAEPYIFAYILGSPIKGKGGHRAAIERIKRKYGNIKVIAVVVFGESQDIESAADEVVYDASPEEWLNYIKYASFVYTDSFHGCLFSMKYEKQFLGYYSLAHRATRLFDIAERYGVSRYIVSSISDIDKKQCIETPARYDEITPLLEKHIKESKDFIKDAPSYK